MISSEGIVIVMEEKSVESALVFALGQKTRLCDGKKLYAGHLPQQRSVIKSGKRGEISGCE